MTIASTPPRNDYIGTGSTATYSYTFRIFAATDLRVTKQDTAGVETALIYPTDYSVTGVNNASGGSITLTAGNLPAGYTLTIRFDRVPRQSTDLRNQGGFFAQTHEDKFDELTRYSQQNADELDRSLKLPETEAGTPAKTVIPATANRANKYLAFDSSGQPIAVDAASASGTSVTATGSSTARLLADRFAAEHDLKNFEALGNDSANDTTAFSNFLAAGGGYIDDGTYRVGTVTASVPFKVRCGPNVIIKQLAGTGSSNWITVNSGASGSVWEGGTFDGNKANQTFTSLTVALSITDVDDLTISTNIINTIGRPIWANGCDRLTATIRTTSCTGVASFWFCQYSNLDVITVGTDNAGRAIYQHAIDFFDLTYCRVSGENYGQNADSSGSSYAGSGISLLRCSRCTFDRLVSADDIMDTVYSLGVSFVACMENTVGTVVGIGCRVALEFAGCRDMVLSNVMVNGKFRLTTATPSLLNITGVVNNAGGQYGDGLSGSITGSRNIHIVNCEVVGCGTGFSDIAGGFSFGNLACIGNAGDGVRLQHSTIPNPYFAGVTAPNVMATSLGTVNLSGNGRAGIMIDETLHGLSITGGRIMNNGQDTSNGATSRIGVGAQTSNVKKNIIISGCVIGDTQNFTYSNMMTYTPGSTTSNRYTFTVLTNPGVIGLGENITLVNVLTGPANVSGKVVTIDRDDYTVEFASAQTFVDNLDAGTGTLVSSGTTVTGTSTLFLTEILGRCWIKANGQYRQVMKVLSNTSLTIDTAFSPNLGGHTFDRVRCDVTGIPSQQYGARWATAAGMSDLDFGNNIYTGNVVADIFSATSLSVEPDMFRHGAEATLFQTGTFSGGTTTDVYSSVPPGYEIVGYRFQILTDVTGTTGSTISLALQGGSTQSLATGLGVTKNTKSAGNVVPERLTANTTLRATFGGGADNTPTGGTYRAELRVRRSGFADYANVP